MCQYLYNDNVWDQEQRSLKEHWNIGTLEHFATISDFGSKFQPIAKFYYQKPKHFKFPFEIHVLSSKFFRTFLGTFSLLDFCSIIRPGLGPVGSTGYQTTIIVCQLHIGFVKPSRYLSFSRTYTWCSPSSLCFVSLQKTPITQIPVVETLSLPVHLALVFLLEPENVDTTSLQQVELNA